METNIVGRFHNTSASGGPNTIKLGLLDIDDNTSGNGNGFGLADCVSKKLYDKLVLEATYLNAITSTEPNSVKLPPVLNSDKEVFQGCIKLCGKINKNGDIDYHNIKLVIIENTKYIDKVYMSKAAFEAVVNKEKVEKVGDYFNIKFDREGNYKVK